MTEESEHADRSLPDPDYRKRRRRMRSGDEKRRMVEETLAEGASVAEVARRHGVNANLLFKWRKLYARGGLEASHEPDEAQLVPVVLSQAPSPVSPEKEPTPAVAGAALDLLLPCGITVRLRRGSDLALLPELLSILDAR